MPLATHAEHFQAIGMSSESEQPATFFRALQCTGRIIVQTVKLCVCWVQYRMSSKHHVQQFPNCQCAMGSSCLG